MVKCFIVIIIMWLVGNGTAINSLIQFPQKKKKKKKEKFQTTGKLCSFIEKPGINFSFLKKKKEREREREREGFAEISPKFSQST